MASCVVTETVECPICGMWVKVEGHVGMPEPTADPTVMVAMVTAKFEHDCPGRRTEIPIPRYEPTP